MLTGYTVRTENVLEVALIYDVSFPQSTAEFSKLRIDNARSSLLDDDLFYFYFHFSYVYNCVRNFVCGEQNNKFKEKTHNKKRRPASDSINPIISL